MNILVSLNRKYLFLLNSLIKSILNTNEDAFNIYVMSRDITMNDLTKFERVSYHLIILDENDIKSLPVVEKRYPKEIYFRLYASLYLPKDIDRILYLDTDIIVINKLNTLYNMDFEGNLYIGCSNIRKVLHIFHEIRLGIKGNSPYLNTGVLLINLKDLRNYDVRKLINNFLKKKKHLLMLPDQDILNTVYQGKLKRVDSLIYNLSDRGIFYHNFLRKNKIDLNWVKNNTVIIHYYGRNKPWGKHYKGVLDYFYKNINK